MLGLLDPDKALDAVNQAVALVKKASKTVDNVASLGPVLGKYFDAKADALNLATQAQGISRGKALEIEMAIDANREFENELKNLFIASGKIDVWNKATARAEESQKAALEATKKAKLAAKRKADKDKEMEELILAIFLGVVLLGLACWGGWELLVYCKKSGCGR